MFEEDDDDEVYPPSREATWKADALREMIEGWRMSVADESDFPDTKAASAELDSRMETRSISGVAGAL